MNSPETIAWLVLFGMATVALVLTVDLIQYHIRKRRNEAKIAKNDSTIFQTAEEARRDFR